MKIETMDLLDAIIEYKCSGRPCQLERIRKCLSDKESDMYIVLSAMLSLMYYIAKNSVLGEPGLRGDIEIGAETRIGGDGYIRQCE
jgi:hypothetical protein